MRWIQAAVAVPLLTFSCIFIFLAGKITGKTFCVDTYSGLDEVLWNATENHQK